MLDLDNFLTWLGFNKDELEDGQDDRIRFALIQTKNEVQDSIRRFVMPTPLKRDVRFGVDFDVQIESLYNYSYQRPLFRIIFKDSFLNDIVSITKLAYISDSSSDETVIDATKYMIDDNTRELILLDRGAYNFDIPKLRIEGTFGISNYNGEPQTKLINAIYALVSRKCGILSRNQFNQQDGVISSDDMTQEYQMAQDTIAGYSLL